MTAPPSTPLAHGIHLIDTAYVRPGLAASYLVVQDGHAAFIETGTNPSTPRLLAALAGQDLDPADVDLVIVTHVHLDHAGGAGSLMRTLPNAKLVAHPKGARHLIDPTTLIAGVIAVYGEETYRASYGELIPVPADRVLEAPDAFTLELAGRPLHFYDTPGHARHHLSVWDPTSAGIFSGDVFGLAYRELDTDAGPFIFPSTSPVQFEPEPAKASIDRLLALDPRRIFLTHFGEVTNLEELAADLHSTLDASVAVANEHRDSPERHQRILADLTDLMVQRAADHGCAQDRSELLDLWGMDLELNAQGLEVWLDRQS